MASLKGGDYFWNAATISPNAKSALINIGPGPWVGIYIDNQSAVSMTFKVQVAATAAPQAGRNALDGTADGGLTWFDLKSSSNGTDLTALTVAAGAVESWDLSPFAPPFIRLVRTDSNAAGEVTALITCFGPN